MSPVLLEPVEAAATAPAEGEVAGTAAVAAAGMAAAAVATRRPDIMKHRFDARNPAHLGRVLVSDPSQAEVEGPDGERRVN